MSAQAVQPFVIDRDHPIVPARHVRVAREPQRVGVPLEREGQPSVELIEDGGAVRAILVVCTCGRQIRLRCDDERGE